jgi:hypothetical protein
VGGSPGRGDGCGVGGACLVMALEVEGRGGFGLPARVDWEGYVGWGVGA